MITDDKIVNRFPCYLIREPQVEIAYKVRNGEQNITWSMNRLMKRLTDSAVAFSWDLFSRINGMVESSGSDT